MERTTPKPRKITRLKTGCRTCRIRRVKCDETPGVCLRCTSTGRKCDSYDLNRLPVRRGFMSAQLNQYRPQATNWASKTSDERRCLSYFQFLTIPTMNYWFDHSLWDTLIPQLAQAEPAVCHAVVAFSTLQEASDVARGAAPTVMLEDMTNRHHRFAVEQYNRSIAHLNLRISSNDPTVKNTVLICCFLYVLFELLRGKYDKAFTHLKRGVEILRNQQSVAPQLNGRIEDSIATAMTHLDLQGAHFGVSQLHDNLLLSQLESRQVEETMKFDFHTLSEAWVLRDKLFHEFCTFCSFYDRLTAKELAENSAVLSVKAKKHQAQLVVFERALDRLEATVSQQKTITKKQQRAFHVMRMHNALLSLMIEISIVDSSQLVREKYKEKFVQLVDLAEQIVYTLLADDDHCRVRIVMEIGIITPLYIVAEKCGDMALILRAKRVIESWPHREGLWDSDLALTLLHGMITVLNDKKQ